METYEATVSLSPQQAADKIRAHILNSISGECLDEVRRQVADKTLIAMVFEKFYYRAGNRLTLSVLIDDFSGQTRVRSVGGGGGEGIFIRFDWGASASFAPTPRRLRPAGRFFALLARDAGMHIPPLRAS